MESEKFPSLEKICRYKKLTSNDDEFYRAYLINRVEDLLQAWQPHQGQVVSVDPGFPLATAGPVTEAQPVLNSQRALDCQSGHLHSLNLSQSEARTASY